MQNPVLIIIAEGQLAANERLGYQPVGELLRCGKICYDVGAVKRFKEYSPDQPLLLPPALNDWLKEGHLAYFIRDVVGELDLSAIYADYRCWRGGQPAYDPQMMVSLLLYGYCVGIASSRKIEQATYEQVPFQVLAADQHPDQDTICTFGRRHLEALSELFVQVLQLCLTSAPFGHGWTS